MNRRRNDLAISRRRMVEEQLRVRGIHDPHVLRIMEAMPRHLFVDETIAERAYSDHALPIGDDQTISQPYMVALMTESLAPAATDVILEVGTGSGYQTAVLGALARRVCSIERLPRLAERARATLEALGVDNVWVRVGNGALGWPDEAPFDRILVAAGGPTVPPPLVAQLAEGGRMVLPVGSPADQILTVIERVGGEIRKEAYGECKFVKLVGKYGWES